MKSKKNKYEIQSMVLIYNKVRNTYTKLLTLLVDRLGVSWRLDIDFPRQLQLVIDFLP